MEGNEIKVGLISEKKFTLARISQTSFLSPIHQESDLALYLGAKKNQKKSNIKL